MKKFKSLLKSFVLTLIFCITSFCITSSISYANIYNVTRLDDPIPDGCLVNDCSLREAVNEANLQVGDDEIILQAGVYSIEIPPDALNEDNSGDFDIISGSLTITGQGSWQTSIIGDFIDRVFDVNNADLVIKSIDISKGASNDEYGGGIRVVDGSLTLDQVTVRNNFSGINGGAISVHGSVLFASNLTIKNAYIARNKSYRDGAGLFCDYCTVNISDSFFQYNDSGESILGLARSDVEIDRTTISHNISSAGALKTYYSTEFAMKNSTISDNISTSVFTISTFEMFGDSESEGNGVTLVGNTIVANQGDSQADVLILQSEGVSFSENIIDANMVFYPFQSDGYNILRDSISLPSLASSDYVMKNSSLLELMPLANNGSLGLTHELGQSSIAKRFKDQNCHNIDHRGINRNNPVCDVGSFQTGYCNDTSFDVPDSDSNGIISEITIDDNREILGMELYLNVNHTHVGDLKVELEHVETGLSSELINQPNSGGCTGDNINIIISELDQNALGIDVSCQSQTGYREAFPQLTKRFKPLNGSLSLFNNIELGGTWQLKISDLLSEETGKIEGWCLYPKLNFDDLIFANGF